MHLCIPWICYNHTMLCEHVMSMLRLILFLKDHAIHATLSPIPFDSLINRARNAAVAMCLSNPEYTHLLFIDTDIEFDPADVMKLILADKPVVGAGYAQKFLPMDRLRSNLIQHPTAADPIALSTKCSVHLSAGDQPIASLMEASTMTTGFLLLQRAVLEGMAQAYPERRYVNDIDGYARADPSTFYDFFCVGIHPETKRLESEDYGFCRLWKSMGGKIYAVTDIALKHHGWFGYSHHLYHQLRQQLPLIPAASPDADSCSKA